MRTWARAILTLLFAAVLATFYYQHLPPAGEGTDFPQLYCAAKIVGAGMGHQLYDVHLQWEFQRRYTGRIGNFFIHPPFETLIYLPFAMLPLRAAYLAWTVFNFAILGCTAWLLHRCLGVALSPLLIFVLSVSFVPVVLNFFQGQDAILLLLVFTVAFGAVAQGRDFAAGCLLALGLFKFQFVLPVAIVFLLARRFKFLAGFTTVAAGLVVVSIGIAGWSSLLRYPRLLLDLNNIPFSGVHPNGIPNLRGMSAMLVSGTSVASHVVVASMSLTIVLIAGAGWRRAKSLPGVAMLALSNLVLAALLCSYQASPHDLALAVIPICLTYSCLRMSSDITRSCRILYLTILLVIFLPPLHVYMLRLHLYVLLALPLAFLFALNCVEMRRSQSA